MTIRIGPKPLEPFRPPEQIVFDCLKATKDGFDLDIEDVKRLVNWRYPAGNDRVCEVVLLMAGMLAERVTVVPRPKADAFAVSTAIMSAISRASDLSIQSRQSFTRADVRIVIERVLREKTVCR